MILIPASMCCHDQNTSIAGARVNPQLSGHRCLLAQLDDLTDFGAQDLANVAWAAAVQQMDRQPLVVSIALEAQRRNRWLILNQMVDS